MKKHVKQAVFSALLVWAVAFPVLGLKLSVVGVNLEVHGQGPTTIAIIALCSVCMFLRVLFDRQWSGLIKNRSVSALIPHQVGSLLSIPRSQKLMTIALIIAALVWPFFGSRGAVDIATLILIYILLGLGLNIV
ncbi:DUF3382 domain-containing protein, partial [Pseudomonas fluorescens]